MTEQQQFIESVEQDLAKSDIFERIGFDPEYRPSIEEVKSLTEVTCQTLSDCLPDKQRQDVLIGRVRLASEQAIFLLMQQTQKGEGSSAIYEHDKRHSSPQNVSPQATFQNTPQTEFIPRNYASTTAPREGSFLKSFMRALPYWTVPAASLGTGAFMATFGPSVFSISMIWVGAIAAGVVALVVSNILKSAFNAGD